VSLVEVSLGALLHDVGKFMQRAHSGQECLSEQSLRMMEQICPVRSGRSSHDHVLFTNEFVSGLSFWPDGLRPAEVANLAAFHHRPDTPEQNLIAEADRLSSGMDRREPEESGGARLRRVRMRSVAAGIALEGGAGVQAALNLGRLRPEVSFPDVLTGEPAAWDQEDLTGQYRKLWDGFVQEWKENQCPDPVGFVNRAASTMERYFWCVPSATNAFPDISLYDHSATTAAIAGCLFEAGGAASPFLLAAGDLTGIQGYVYGLRHGAGGLARRLRARSFDVAAWSEAVSLAILAKLGLPMVHRIVYAGGKFHLLLPNTEQARSALVQTRAEAASWLFNRSGGQLGLSLAWMEADAEGLKNFSRTMTLLHARLRDARDQPGRDALIVDGRWNEARFALPPLEVSGEEQACPCCRLRVAEVIEEATKEGEEPKKVCSVCHEDGQRGRLLPKTRYVAFGDAGAAAWAAPVGSYGLAASPAKCAPGSRMIVDMDGQGQAPGRLPVVGGWRARRVPTDPSGDVKEFESLAKVSQGRLGYLKMDVDNLGYLMAHGLRGEDADRSSISRVATLSRTLELFFSGYLESLLRAEYQDIYLVYSGGDDVLAIGPWSRVLDLALRLRKEFRRFTAGNRAWSLSAGVAVVHHKTPVLAAANEADELLKVSKTIPGAGFLPVPSDGEPRGSPTKDRITAFGVSMPWNGFEAAMASARRLLKWMQEGVVNTGKARRLLKYARMYREFQRTGDTRQFEYAPLLAYDISRNWQGIGAAFQEARVWAAGLGTPGSEEMEMLFFTCQYALLSARLQGEEDD